MSFHRRKITMESIIMRANSTFEEFDRYMMAEACVFAEDGSHVIWETYRASGTDERINLHATFRTKANSKP
jgi:hypothetical protein